MPSIENMAIKSKPIYYLFRLKISWFWRICCAIHKIPYVTAVSRQPTGLCRKCFKPHWYNWLTKNTEKILLISKSILSFWYDIPFGRSVDRSIGPIVKTTNNFRILNFISVYLTVLADNITSNNRPFSCSGFSCSCHDVSVCELCRYFEREILNRPIQETETKYRLNEFSGVDIVTAELVHVHTHFICRLECFDHIATLMLMLLVIALNCYGFAHII